MRNTSAQIAGVLSLTLLRLPLKSQMANGARPATYHLPGGVSCEGGSSRPHPLHAVDRPHNKPFVSAVVNKLKTFPPRRECKPRIAECVWMRQSVDHETPSNTTALRFGICGKLPGAGQCSCFEYEIPAVEGAAEALTILALQ